MVAEPCPAAAHLFSSLGMAEIGWRRRMMRDHVYAAPWPERTERPRDERGGAMARRAIAAGCERLSRKEKR